MFLACNDVYLNDRILKVGVTLIIISKSQMILRRWLHISLSLDVHREVNGCLERYFFSKVDQKDLALRFSDIVDIDCTHECNNKEIPLHEILALDASTNETPVSLGFLAIETSELVSRLLIWSHCFTCCSRSSS